MSMLAACGGLAYLHATREQATEDQARTIAAPQSKIAAEPSRPANDVPSTTEPEPSSQDETTPNKATAAPPESVAQWIKDTQSLDPKTRAAAIAALADAPKSQAMPALERVIKTGEPDVDRHIALRSMHALALRDGDSTGQIRNVMRNAIYHGDDDGVTQTAQSLLDDIEAEFATREQPQK